jgi:hypothetical protein
LTTWDRYRTDKRTGLEVELHSGKTWIARAYCDDNSASGIYQGKSPVCKLAIDPTTQFTGQAQAWDISDSMSATSTIDVFYIDWGGATDIGNLSAQDWATDPLSGNVTYDAAGTYTVEAWVKDLLGVESQHVFITVEVVDPVERVYIGTPAAGVFISDNGSTPAASNSGLSGDDLKVRAVRLNPHTADLPAGEQHVWLCTLTGLAYSTDGAATWTTISKATLGEPVNTADDDPAPETGDLDQIDVCFDPQDEQRVYCLRTTATRSWLYVSDDYGASWSNTQVGS